jgi:hypothetical protein
VNLSSHQIEAQEASPALLVLPQAAYPSPVLRSRSRVPS